MKTHVHKKDLYKNVQNSFIHNSQKLKILLCPLTGKWISKLWYICTVQCWLLFQHHGILAWVLPWGCNYVRQSCSHRKACLGLQNLLPRWLTHLAVGRGPQFLPTLCSPWSCMSVLMKGHWLLSLSDPWERTAVALPGSNLLPGLSWGFLGQCWAKDS